MKPHTPIFPATDREPFNQTCFANQPSRFYTSCEIADSIKVERKSYEKMD